MADARASWNTTGSRRDRIVGRFARVRPRRGDDRGFTIIETLVAMIVLSVVLVSVEKGMSQVGVAANYARQRDVALNLITGDVSQLEALPYGDLEAGLNPAAFADNSLASDPNVEDESGTYVLKLNNATIETANSSTSEAPLVPYDSQVTIGNTYNVYTYPTTSTSAPGVVTVTVVVSWASPSGATTTASGETELTLP